MPLTPGKFTIDGVAFSAKSIKPTYESLASEDSGRTDDGTMHISWVLSRVRKVEIEMAPCNSALASAILNAVQGRTYTLGYQDPLDNAWKEIECYTSNSSADLYSGVIYNGLWQGISFNAIELGGEI